MGAHLARRYLWDAEVEPDPVKMPTFDPHFGFPEERKERALKPSLAPQAGLATALRVMIATEQQMNEAQLPLDMRDYCAHYFLKWAKCKRDKFPNIFACKHERHDWDYCEHLDYVMRMKEFERERRLLARKKRIEQKAKAAAAAASAS